MISVPTPSDLRAAIARRRVKVYVLAAKLGVHPSRLSLLLNERVPIAPDLAERMLRAIEEEAAAR